jgi:hypothetical protein
MWREWSYTGEVQRSLGTDTATEDGRANRIRVLRRALLKSNQAARSC